MTGSVVKMAALAAAAAGVLAVATPAQAQDTKVVLGMSGWTGFAPLTLADKASDEPTADLLTQRLTVHEQQAWMLRSLLED